MKIVQFTHSDADGVACAVVAFYKYNQHEHIVHYLDYYDIDQKIISELSAVDFKNQKSTKDTVFLITDICPKKETLDKLDVAHKAGLSIQLFDHHKTRSYCSAFSWATYSETKCGALLTLEGLLKKEERGRLVDFVKGIDAYDRWDLASGYRKKGERLNLLLKFFGIKLFFDKFILNPWADTSPEIYSIISILEENQTRYVQKIIENQAQSSAQHLDDFGYQYKVIVASEHTATIGATILADEDNADLKYVIVVNPIYGIASFYSREGECDVSELAKRLGGGGHASAAGFPLDSKTLIEQKIASLLDKIDTKD